MFLRLHIDKTAFVTAYQEKVLQLDELTKHQRDSLATRLSCASPSSQPYVASLHRPRCVFPQLTAHLDADGDDDCDDDALPAHIVTSVRFCLVSYYS